MRPRRGVHGRSDGRTIARGVARVICPLAARARPRRPVGRATFRLASRRPPGQRWCGDVRQCGGVGSWSMSVVGRALFERRSGRAQAGFAAVFPRVIHRALIALAALAALSPCVTRAESLPEALVRAYQDNPQLNAERAKLRGTDENVSQALAGYRPQVTVGLSSGLIALRNLLPDSTSQSALLKPWTAGLTINQTLFNGFKTSSTARQAEAQLRSGRVALRAVEQGVLLDGATVY